MVLGGSTWLYSGAGEEPRFRGMVADVGSADLPGMSAEIANRQELIADLSRALEPDGRERLLMLVRLHGLPTMAERCGQAAHDRFLSQAYELLQRQVGPAGRAYTTRRDELCALLDTSLDQAIDVLDNTTSALNKLGAGDHIRADAGVALLPEEASDAVGALTRADRRILPADTHPGHGRQPNIHHRRRGDHNPDERIARRTMVA
jgi:GGDEF domain-containing protein